MDFIKAAGSHCTISSRSSEKDGGEAIVNSRSETYSAEFKNGDATLKVYVYPDINSGLNLK